MEPSTLDQEQDFTIEVEESNPSPPPSFGQTLLAPLWIINPATAATRMVHGSRLAFWLSYWLGILTLAGVILFLNMWSLTVYRVFSGRYQVRERSFAEAWQLMHANQTFGDAELIVILICLLAVPVTLLGAFLYLPTVHNGGRAWPSFQRAFAAIASGIGFLNLLVVMIGGSIVFIDNRGDLGHGPEDVTIMILIILSHICVVGLFYWLHLAARAVAGPRVEAELPPRCEGCGYDLTHQSSEGLCTECGLDLDASLVPDLRRPGSAWQVKADDRGWLTSSVSSIFHPNQFYGRLKLRTPLDEDTKFVRWHFCALSLFGGFGSVLLILIMSIMVGNFPPAFFICGMPFVFTIIVPMVCWIVKHIVAAMVTSWCVATDALPDASWMKRIIACETAYLWVFCFYTVTLALSFIFFEDWISRLTRAIMPGLSRGFQAEFIAVLFGNIFICLAWFWRYRIAIHRVRWSNY